MNLHAPQRRRGGHDLICDHCGTSFHRPYNLSAKRRATPQYCNQGCAARARAAAINKTDEFWARVKKAGPDECWLWQGEINDTGYGVFGFRGNRRFLAHRASFIMANGEIPPELPFICHRCDNPPCVNPAHLFAGTQKDNMSDAAAKGRTNRAPTTWGATHPKARLTAEQAIAIYESGEPKKTLAARYGITPTAVHLIKTGKNWAHATGARTK